MEDGYFWVFMVIMCSFISMLAGVFAGHDLGKQQYTTEPVKPSITITNVDGVVDTTYTYTFK